MKPDQDDKDASEARGEKNQTARTDVTGSPNAPSSNWEEPADEGAAVDQAEIASAAQPTSTAKPKL